MEDKKDKNGGAGFGWNHLKQSKGNITENHCGISKRHEKGDTYRRIHRTYFSVAARTALLALRD